MSYNQNDEISNVEELGKTFEKLGSPIQLILEAIGNSYSEMNKLNNSFLQGKTRLDEMYDAVTKASSGVIRIGGNITDVSRTMIGIAEGSRRNVIATEEQVSKLYAAAELLDTTSKSLVENFAQVGVSVSNIGPSLEKSITYVQNIGLNAKVVMTDVTSNMSLMNRFNFSDGVQGLTKMAAQASMLRWDMSQTATFAEKVMTPEGAINTASALQRLGVAVGQLGDPFALMNDAINDPGALQDSLIKATKQFTEFDEKTQRFKINPQGILTLREMATETGINYDQLAKSALAAADLDTRLSKINPSINFKNEDDKKLLANMATMGDEGEYVVQIKNDETQIVEQKKLSEITAEEFEKLRNQPKTLEEIQTSQLGVLKQINSAISGVAAAGTYGIAGTSIVSSNLVGAGRLIGAAGSSINENTPQAGKISETLNEGIKGIASFIENNKGNLTKEEISAKFKEFEYEIKSNARSLGSSGIETLKKILEDTNNKVTGTSDIEKYFKTFANETISTWKGEVTEKPKNKTAITGTKKVEPIKSSVFAQSDNSQTNSSQNTITSKSSVDFGGTVTIKIDAPSGVDQKYLDNVFKSDDFKQMIYKYYDEKSKNNLLTRKN